MDEVTPTEAEFARASAETERLSRELDITNADHIVLWLETNLQEDGEVSLPWLACRIVEAHEVAREQSIAPYREAVTKLLAVFDEQKQRTRAEAIITGRSDAQLRADGNAAIEALRTTLQQGAK